jgi:hypothetical protein
LTKFLVPRRLALFFGLGVFAAPFLGCEQPEEIEHYRQLKPEAVLKTYFKESAAPEPEPVPEPDRMFAAIVPHGGQLWFFKLVGPTDAVRTQSDPFSALVASVHFGNDAPQWKLPKDWKQLPASGTGPGERFATIQIGGGEKPLELSVTSLPKQEDEDDGDAVLINVNRWRRQMGREPIDKRQIKTTTRERKTADGGPAYVLGLLGKFQPGGMSRPPVVGASEPQMPAGHPAVESSTTPSDANPSTTSSGISGELEYEVPAGWHSGQAGGMRKAAFAVENGSRSVSITVVVTEGSLAADIAANVNRWRGQFGLAAAEAREIAAMVKPIQFGDTAGSYVEIVGPKDPGPQQAVYSAIAPRNGKVWSITMRGDAELAARERERFAAFVKSIQFGEGGN